MTIDVPVDRDWLDGFVRRALLAGADPREVRAALAEVRRRFETTRVQLVLELGWGTPPPAVTIDAEMTTS